MIRSLTLATLLAAASLAPIALPTATAAPLTRSGVLTTQDGVRYQVVRYGDLNLAHADGNQALYRRIVKSAERVCERHTPMRPTFRADVAACRAAAVSRAVQEIGQSKLTSIHLAATSARRGRG